MLLIKLLFTPLCMGLATLIARRFGPAAGGLFTAMPLLSGPISFFLYLEQGQTFAVNALHSSMLGYAAIVFCVPPFLFFAKRGSGWMLPVLAGSVGYAAAAWCARLIQHNVHLDMALTVGVLAAGLLLIPHPQNPKGLYLPRWWDLPLRMLTAALIVWGITELAHLLGPNRSGYLSTYPSMSFMMAAFTFVQSGYPATIFYWRGLLGGMFGSVFFFYILILTLGTLPVWGAYALAVLVNLIANGVVFWLMSRASAKPRKS